MSDDPVHLQVTKTEYIIFLTQTHRTPHVLRNIRPDFEWLMFGQCASYRDVASHFLHP